jgi:hypothetical protein
MKRYMTGGGTPFEHLEGEWVRWQDVSAPQQQLGQERDWLRRHYDLLREWLPKHQPCLFCGSDIELRQCTCGKSPHMNLNDIDYEFFCVCECGRNASGTGGTPLENHDACVREWNATGWNGPARK